MARKTLIVSVPHTGTRTLRRLVSEYTGVSCHSTHTFNEMPYLMKTLKDRLLICPLRHPGEVWGSWARRAGTSHSIRLHRFMLSWRQLNELTDLFDITFVPVDKPGIRDVKLREGMRIVGPTNFDWDERTGHLDPIDLSYERLSNGVRLDLSTLSPQSNGVDFEEIHAMPFIREVYGSYC